MTKHIEPAIIELGLLKLSIIKAISNSEDAETLKAIAEQLDVEVEVPEDAASPDDASAQKEIPAATVRSGVSLEDIVKENANKQLSFTTLASFGDNDDEISLEEELALLTK